MENTTKVDCCNNCSYWNFHSLADNNAAYGICSLHSKLLKETIYTECDEFCDDYE
jgi:hypothetical protein